MQFSDGLNNEQRRAVEAGGGPVLIVAGPGTGKTKTLTARIEYLIKSGQAKPAEILALTFTKKAAEEMRSRIAAGRGQKPQITTFHALCHELLGSDHPFATDAQRLQVIKSLPKPKQLKGLSTRELGLIISRAKNMPQIDDTATAKVVNAYNQALADQDLRDFDDLLLKTYKLLKSDESARKTIQKRYNYILVDEFQDTNRIQYELLHLLRGNDNLFVIGDPNQSIYGFRGASGDIFEKFQQDFPDAQKITLHDNYRSIPEVVRLSNAIFANAAPQQANTIQTGHVQTVQVLNEYSEANWVLDRIQHAIGGGDFLKAVSDDERAEHRRLNDFAVLYRSRLAAAALQKLVGESGLPYQVVGDGSPYEKPQVQTVIALMRGLMHDELPLLDNLSAEQVRQAWKLLLPHKTAKPAELADKIISTLGFGPSRDLSQLLSTLVRFDKLKTAVDYFDDIADSNFYDPNADAITLLTIHAAKGLEFPHVFLIGTQEGILPSERGDPEEERRLFYVAATRAREQLDILHAKTRSGKRAQPSRFITELSDDVLPKIVDENLVADQRRAQKRKLKRSQQSLF